MPVARPLCKAEQMLILYRRSVDAGLAKAGAGIGVFAPHPCAGAHSVLPLL